MAKVTDIVSMSPDEFRMFLHTVIAESIFTAREVLLRLLNDAAASERRETLDSAFREFFCGYEGLALWLEEYEEDPLDSLEAHTALFKKLKRQREYILTNRKTTLKERIHRRTGRYLASDPMPSKRISDLPTDEFRGLLRGLVTQELFEVRERLIVLLAQHAPLKALDAAFREFFVAYEFLELLLEDYDYDPDEGLALRPEIIARLAQSDAEIKAGTAELIPVEEVMEELGMKW